MVLYLKAPSPGIEPMSDVAVIKLPRLWPFSNSSVQLAICWLFPQLAGTELLVPWDNMGIQLFLCKTGTVAPLAGGSSLLIVTGQVVLKLKQRLNLAVVMSYPV